MYINSNKNENQEKEIALFPKLLFIYTERRAKGFQSGHWVISDWLDLCVCLPVCCCGTEDLLAGLSVLFLLH